ncbi:hypothetical protein JNUCC42_03745 [Brevibacterium sp. JNUCC-42]|nr:hypothetical protein JNUCC42_03745 [Brevibacterium sp. JNUCC-42]
MKLIQVQEKAPSLTDYDVEVVALAKERAVLCTSNERKIHQICDEYDIESTGTLGVLCCAYEHRVIEHTEFSKLIRKLCYETSSWISSKLKKQIMDHYKIPDYPLILD